jgi:hypothetical protein
MTTTPSPLAQAAAKIRADIKTAAANRTLPDYPEGVTFRVRSRRASLMQAIDIEVLGVPRSWLYESRPGAVNRPSPAWLLLRDALERTAARHFAANGSTSFIDVQVDSETGTDA